MPRRSLLIVCIFLLAAACGPSTTTPQPSPTASPTMEVRVSPTAFPIRTQTTIPNETLPTVTIAEESSSTPEVIQEATSEETLPPAPTLIPIETAVSTAVPQPAPGAGAIQLYSPGPQSKVVSPLKIYGYAIPGYKDKGQVILYGEDGRVVASEMLQLNTSYKWAYFYWPLPFSIASAGELGRLSMSTQDQYGRTTALYSVHLLLFPEGEEILNPPGDLNERCVLTQPVVGQHVSGGILSVKGKMQTFNNLPLTVELIGRDGTILSSQLVQPASQAGEPADFQTEIPYTLDKGTWELLRVSQFDDRISGLMYLFSQEVFLSP